MASAIPVCSRSALSKSGAEREFFSKLLDLFAVLPSRRVSRGLAVNHDGATLCRSGHHRHDAHACDAVAKADTGLDRVPERG